jgi:hypothetical protein
MTDTTLPVAAFDAYVRAAAWCVQVVTTGGDDMCVCE